MECFVEPVREHRLALILRGENLHPALADTDPQQTGVPPREPAAQEPRAEGASRAVKEFLRQAGEILSSKRPANMILLRGFSSPPKWPTLEEVHGLRGCASAVYPMYRGLARLLGLEIVAEEDDDLDGQVSAVEDNWDRFDFFFLHHKDPDSRGEDGNFQGKVEALEQLDTVVPRLRALRPDIMIVTGDHSTPSTLSGHSWHPVPVVMAGPTVRPDLCTAFGETTCGRAGY